MLIPRQISLSPLSSLISLEPQHMVVVWSILRADLYPRLISGNALTDIPKDMSH